METKSKTANSMQSHTDYLCVMCGYKTQDISRARKHAARLGHQFDEWRFG